MLLRPPGVRPSEAFRVLQPPLRLVMCLIVSGHLSAQTTLVVIDTSACLVEPNTRDRRIKCAPHGPLAVSFVSLIVGLCAVLHRPLTYAEILTCSWTICFSALSAGTFGFSSLWAGVSRRICQPEKISRWLQLFLCCMSFERQFRFTSSHLRLNLLNSVGRTSIQLRARSHASRRIELPLLESVSFESDLGNLEDVPDHISSIFSTSCGSALSFDLSLGMSYSAQPLDDLCNR